MTGLEQHLDAIDQLMERKLPLPAISLIYVVVENFAWLESGDKKGSKARFLDWTTRYLLPVRDSDLTAMDLYGARCGVIHTGTSISDLSEDGKARKVNYKWGKINPLIEWAGNETSVERDEVMVRIEDLLSSLRGGIKKYFEELERAGDTRADIKERLQKIFTSVSEKAILAGVEERRREGK